MKRILILLVTILSFTAKAQKINTVSTQGSLAQAIKQLSFQYLTGGFALSKYSAPPTKYLIDPTTGDTIRPTIYIDSLTGAIMSLKKDGTWSSLVNYDSLIAGFYTNQQTDSIISFIYNQSKYYTDSVVNSFIANAVYGGSVDSTSNPHPTVNTYWLATQAAVTYDSMGGVRVYPNSIAIISYLAATQTYSISQTPLDLSDYATIGGVYGYPIKIIEPNISALTTGSASALRTYLFNVPIPANQTLKELHVKATTAGNVNICEYSISGGNATLVQNILYTLKVGENVITNFTCASGNYVGIITSTGSLLGRLATATSTSSYGVYVFNTNVTTATALPAESFTTKYGVQAYLESDTAINPRLISLTDYVDSISESLSMIITNDYFRNYNVEGATTYTQYPQGAITNSTGVVTSPGTNAERRWTGYSLIPSDIKQLKFSGFNAARGIHFYDSAFTPIGLHPAATTPTDGSVLLLDVIPNAKYFAHSIYTGTTQEVYANLFYGYVSKYYAPYNDFVDLEASALTSDEILTYKNLFNKATVNTGRYLSSGTGNEVTQASSAISDYIEVEDSTTYTVSGLISLSDPTANVVVFYDAAKVKLSYVSGLGNYTHTTPANTKYVRFNVRFTSGIVNYDAVQYEKDTIATDYIAFGQAKIKEELLDIPEIDAESNTLAPITDLWLIPSYGQSLSIGTDGGATTFSAPVDIAYTTTYANSNVTDMNGGCVEMLKTMAAEFEPFPDSFKIMTCLGGAGGKSVLELSKGSSYYNTLISNVVTAKNTADSLGKTFNVPAFMWTQGEEDMRANGVPSDYGSGDWNPFEYADKLQQLIDDFNTDVKSITGQKNDVKCIMYQVGSHNPYYRYPRIAMQQLKLAIEDPRVSIGKTMYDVDYNIADYVHCPNRTYRNMGNNYAISIFEATRQGKHPMPIHPASYYIIGNDVYIRFYVPVPPLAFDTTIVAPLPDGKYGFNLYTVTNETAGATGTIALASQTINSVSIYNANTVKLTLSAIPPAGTRLTYGVNGDGSLDIDGTGTGGKSGRTLGARGNIKDSRTYINTISGSLVQLSNWCPIFEIVF